jgi:hypothetical protein
LCITDWLQREQGLLLEDGKKGYKEETDKNEQE